MKIVYKRRMFLSWVLVSAFCCVFSLVPAKGFAYPMHKDIYVNDFAKVIDRGDEENLRRTLGELQKKTGIQIVVVTVKSIKSYKTGDSSIESFATGLFNKWGIGSKRRNNGILILVAVKDRKMRIELGKGWPGRYDAVMKGIIDNTMAPYFKDGKYSRGIFEGTRAVIEAVTQKGSWFSYYKWHIVIGILIVVCVFAGISCWRSGKKGWGFAFFAAAGILLFALLKLGGRGGGTGFGGGMSSGGGATGSW